MIVDCHCHLDYADFTDTDEVIERAKSAGVVAIISNGLDPTSNRAVLKLAKKFPIVKAALGLYPIDALGRDTGLPLYDVDEELKFIEANCKKIVAIGEVGLDYQNSSEEERKNQREIFLKVIELSQKLKLPMIVHSRKAESDVVQMLEEKKAKQVILHCFSGNFKLIKRASENKWSFSIPTNVVRSQHFQKMVAEIHIGQILTETDAPFLSPFPEKRNEPAFVLEAVKVIAKIKMMEHSEMENTLYMNYQRMFC